MALTQITYTDKVENSGATDDGKVLAVNMNEIKSVTNGVINSLEDTVVKIGSSAGATSQGLNSVAVGKSAGNNTQGSNSVAVGVNAGQTTMGASSVAVGINAGNSSMGNNSVAVGINAGNSSMGVSSVAVGDGAGQNSFGAQAVAIGYQAGQNSTGSYNTFLGRLAGNASTADFNTCVGNGSGANLTTESLVSCLGSGSNVTGSNQVQLGGSTTTAYAYGAVQDRSDERDKADIQDVHLGLDFIEALTPRSYRLDYREDYRENTEDEEGNFIPDTRDLGEITHDGTHKRTRLHCGLVAQEVKQVMDDLGVDFAGYQDHSLNGGQDVKSIGYNELISPMIKAIQELSARVKVLEGS